MPVRLLVTLVFSMFSMFACGAASSPEAGRPVPTASGAPSAAPLNVAPRPVVGARGSCETDADCPRGLLCVAQALGEPDREGRTSFGPRYCARGYPAAMP